MLPSDSQTAAASLHTDQFARVKKKTFSYLRGVINVSADTNEQGQSTERKHTQTLPFGSPPHIQTHTQSVD